MASSPRSGRPTTATREPALVRPGPTLAALPRLAAPGRPRRHRARRRLRHRRPSRSSSRGRRAAPWSASTRAPRCSTSARRRLVLAAETSESPARGLGPGASVRERIVRRADRRVPAPLPGRPARRLARARPRAAAAARRPRCSTSASRRARSLGSRGTSGSTSAFRSPGARSRPAGTRSAASWAAASATSTSGGLFRGCSPRWREAGFADVASRAAQPRRLHRRLGPAHVTEARPAFYALAPGGWRDYVTLLHPPYTALAPELRRDRRLPRAAPLRAPPGGRAGRLLPRDGHRRPRAGRAARPAAADADPRGRARRPRRWSPLAIAVGIGIAGAVAFNALAARLRRGRRVRSGRRLQPRAVRRRYPQRRSASRSPGAPSAADRLLRLRGDDLVDGPAGGRLRDADELRPARALDPCAPGSPPRRLGQRDDRAARRNQRAGHARDAGCRARALAAGAGGRQRCPRGALLVLRLA